MLWEPAIYEHKAALIKESVGEVARSAELLTRAVLEERKIYRSDLITVGVDVYNIEAEACGAEVVPGAPSECPEIRERMWHIDDLPTEPELPRIPDAGRCPMMLTAGQKVQDAIGGECEVRLAASGPVSIAAKLVGTQDLITALALGGDNAGHLLEFTTRLATTWCRAIREAGLNVIIFDSAASPPIISPAMYASEIKPLHARLMKELAGAGQQKRGLIIGGDTVPILGDLADTDATMLICDYASDATAFAEALPRGARLQVRRNVDPSLFLSKGPSLDEAAEELARDLALFRQPIAGTGVLPYGAVPERFSRFRRKVEQRL